MSTISFATLQRDSQRLAQQFEVLIAEKEQELEEMRGQANACQDFLDILRGSNHQNNEPRTNNASNGNGNHRSVRHYNGKVNWTVVLQQLPRTFTPKDVLRVAGCTDASAYRQPRDWYKKGQITHVKRGQWRRV